METMSAGAAAALSHDSFFDTRQRPLRLILHAETLTKALLDITFAASDYGARYIGVLSSLLVSL